MTQSCLPLKEYFKDLGRNNQLPKKLKFVFKFTCCLFNISLLNQSESGRSQFLSHRSQKKAFLSTRCEAKERNGY